MTTHDLAKVDQYDPAQRRALTRTPYSPVMILLTILATAGVLAYAGFLFNPANRGDILPYLLVIGAESILILHALLAMWTVLARIPLPAHGGLLGRAARPVPRARGDLHPPAQRALATGD